MPQTKKEWFDDWFESPWYLKLYSHRTDEEATKAIELFRSKTQLPPSSRVLDLCCGTGRHARSLAECGYRVTGIDYSQYFIAKATRENTLDTLEFIHCDMRDTYPDPPYDAVVNFFTSFGYFEDDAENLLVLKQVHAALRTDGWLLLDYLNEAKVRAHLVPRSVKSLDGAVITEERRIEGVYVIKNITIEYEGNTQHFEERVKLYTLHDFTALCAASSLEIQEYFGSYTAEKYDPTSSPRLIILARKR